MHRISVGDLENILPLKGKAFIELVILPDLVGPVLVEEMEGEALGVGEEDGRVGLDFEAESGGCKIRREEERRGGPW